MTVPGRLFYENVIAKLKRRDAASMENDYLETNLTTNQND